jgi:hypothetical protein
MHLNCAVKHRTDTFGLANGLPLLLWIVIREAGGLHLKLNVRMRRFSVDSVITRVVNKLSQCMSDSVCNGNGCHSCFAPTG